MAGHDLAHALGARDEVVLLVDVDDGQGRGAGERVAVVGEAGREGLVTPRVRDLAAHAQGAQLDVRRSQALGDGHEIGLDAPDVHGEPLAGAAEAAHDLIGDEHDAVLVADVAHALHVAVGRDEDAVGADDGLEDEAGDVLRPLVHDHFFELAQRHVDGLGIRLAPLVEVGCTDDAADADLGAPAAGIAGGHDGGADGAVVGAAAGEDLLATGVVTGDPDGVLVGLGATVGEEPDVEVAGRELGQLPAQLRTRLGGRVGVDVADLLGLGRDGVDDPLVTVADVHRHQLAVEVEDALTVGGVHVDALGVLDGHGYDRVLRHPVEHRVLLRQRRHLVGAQQHSGLRGHLAASYRPCAGPRVDPGPGSSAATVRAPECATGRPSAGLESAMHGRLGRDPGPRRNTRSPAVRLSGLRSSCADRQPGLASSSGWFEQSETKTSASPARMRARRPAAPSQVRGRPP